ncbi:MAG TPA: TfoX/Sxy family protein [Acidimicrobiia bacterium]
MTRRSISAMAYNQGLADDIRAHLGAMKGLSEKEMFGGIAFLVNGNMAVGVSADDLMVRVGKEAHDEAVARPGARMFDLSARPMRGWIVVSPEGIASDADLASWIDQGVAFAENLPPK